MGFVGDIIICILFLGLACFAILEIHYVAKSFRIHCIEENLEENLEEVQKLKPINKYDTLTIIVTWKKRWQYAWQKSGNNSRISNAESAVFCYRPKNVQLYIRCKTKTTLHRDFLTCVFRLVLMPDYICCGWPETGVHIYLAYSNLV